MNLTDTLASIETYLGLDAGTLQPHADADDIGGYHPDSTQAQWGSGAIWDVEGRILHALVRALQPFAVVEIGSGTGCSTTHVAAALHANGGGHITTIDRANTPFVPLALRGYVDIRGGDALEWLTEQPDHSIDLLIEDADHSRQLCAEIGRLAQQKLSSGGVLLAHDAAHFNVGPEVKDGYTRAGLDYQVYLTEPSDCGWLVWKAPVFTTLTPFVSFAGWPESGLSDWPEKRKRTMVTEDGEELDIVDAPPVEKVVEKPKRKRTVKK
jgi:predicted O-methyltransferase YrrM